MKPVQKIKFIADTASDIPDDLLLEYDIDMPSVPITIDGKGYYERRSFTIPEFYRILSRTKEIPKTSRVPVEDYQNCYYRAYQQGFTDIINVTINAGGSGTNASAHMAAELFYAEYAEAKDKINIHIIDSRTYTMAYGYPVVESAKMARAGKSVKDILDYLEDFFSCLEIYLACFTLEYAKKSGRINAAAAFVGDVLGLRPIISMIDGETKIVERVRGEKMLLTQLLRYFDQHHNPADPFAIAACGDVSEYGLLLQEALQKKLGREVPLYYAGASIVINSGPKIVAIICRGKKRR